MYQQNQLIWEDDIPKSSLYGDIYFSKESGLAETTHVFLNGNNLPMRWNRKYSNVIDGITNNLNDFNIIETGFGTGLNFFAAWKLWRERIHVPSFLERNNPMGNLYFTSIEKHPLNISDIKKAISFWPEFDADITEFAAQYPDSHNKESKLIFGSVYLNLIWDDVNNALPYLIHKADAWFLDGFSPAKNPEMWNENLYKNMARLTNLGGTFATFTSAGDVRRGLIKSGFKVIKSAGFGKKRHILMGTFPSVL